MALLARVGDVDGGAREEVGAIIARGKEGVGRGLLRTTRASGAGAARRPDGRMARKVDERARMDRPREVRGKRRKQPWIAPRHAREYGLTERGAGGATGGTMMRRRRREGGGRRRRRWSQSARRERASRTAIRANRRAATASQEAQWSRARPKRKALQP